MQFMAVGGGWEIVLRGAAEPLQLRGGSIHAQHSFVGGARKGDRADMEDDVDLGYVKPQEVTQIPRFAKTPVAIAYAPPGDATFAAHAVLFACKPSGAMRLRDSSLRRPVAGRLGMTVLP
jgi:hypothetical protein